MIKTIQVHGKPIDIDVRPDKICGGWQATYECFEFNGTPSEKFAIDMMASFLERL